MIRTMLLQSLLEGKNNFPNHVVEVLNINSNGKDAKRPDSAIFGYGSFFISGILQILIMWHFHNEQKTCCSSHDGESLRCAPFFKRNQIVKYDYSYKPFFRIIMFSNQVKQKLRGRGNGQSDSAPSKVVIRFCKKQPCAQ